MNDCKRMVLICRSNPVSPDPRVEKCARALVKENYRVHILAWDRRGESSRDEQFGNIRIYRIFIRSKYGTGIQNLFPLIRWQIAQLFWLVKRHKDYDIIHACDLDTVISAIFCKYLWGVKVVYDIFDFYADHIRTYDQIKKLVRNLELSIINKVDAVILVDERRLVQVMGSKPNKVLIINNTPEDILSSIKEKDLQRDTSYTFRMAYIGVLLIDRGFRELFNVLRRHPEWMFELAGYGSDEKQIIAEIRDLRNVKFHGRIPYQQALHISLSADVLLALYDPKVQNNRYASPNKLFEALMLSKPIIVAKNTSMDEIVRQYDMGLVIPYGDENALERSLSRLEKDADLCLKYGRNGRRAYETDYNWSIMENRLVNLYHNL